MDALAGSSSATVAAARKLVPGPVIIRYVSFEPAEDASSEQSGQPFSSGSVSISPGRYRVGYPQNGGCQSYTAFQPDTSGRVKGMDVNSEPVAGRLAAGPSDTANGLALSNVTSLRFADCSGIEVTFTIRNVSNQGVSTDGFLLTFVTSPGGAKLSPDLSQTSINATRPLGPSQTATIDAVFDTEKFTGTLASSPTAATSRWPPPGSSRSRHDGGSSRTIRCGMPAPSRTPR